MPMAILNLIITMKQKLREIYVLITLAAKPNIIRIKSNMLRMEQMSPAVAMPLPCCWGLALSWERPTNEKTRPKILNGNP